MTSVKGKTMSPLSPGQACLLLLEAALGALIILLMAMGVVAVGAWAGFGTVWFVVFLLYLMARLIVASE